MKIIFFILCIMTGIVMGCKKTALSVGTEKHFMDVNGAQNGMFISCTNPENPVLLFISGGPGVPEYWLNEVYADRYPNRISEHFTVCYWDYLGEGLSYDSNIRPEDITIERLASDAVTVSNYLKERFHKEKIYLMAHSSGTHLGIYLAQNCPENFYCYFAMGQDVVGTGALAGRRYQEGYTFMKAIFTENGNFRALRKMEKLVSEKDGEIVILSKKDLAGKWESLLLEAGCATTRDMRSDAKEIFLAQLASPCYTAAEKLNYWKGKFLCVKSEYAKNRVDTEKPALIPVYFLTGRYDYTTPITLAEEFYRTLACPEKAFYTFNDSAHSPLWEENSAVIEVMKVHAR